MSELDHIFCLCPAEAEVAARALARVGLTEGSRSSHPGQGTACRRFFFENAYIELLWVSDPDLAQSEATRRTRLWQRWSKRTSGACPFGIVLRASADPGSAGCPFATWPYRPSYLPPNLHIDIAEGTSLAEPEILYLGFQRERARLAVEPASHEIEVRSLTGVSIGLPASGSISAASRVLNDTGLLGLIAADDHVISLTFDNATSHKTADLRPDVPMVLHW